MQSELPRIKSAIKDHGSILSVAGREEGSIHILLSSPLPVESLRERLQGLHVTLNELLSRAQAPELSSESIAESLAPAMGSNQDGKYRVLFSDDSAIARDLYRILLERNGYQVVVAKDGAEALQMLRESSFDAVVTDDQMPAMDGTELLQVAKSDQRLYRVPFVIISGHASSEARTSALKDGAAAYLVKGSFEKEDFLRLLKEAIEKAKG
jgi:CheY-like chemotaxis protein